MVFFVRITVNQSHLRPICKSTKFNPKIQRTIYLINFQQLRLHVPEFIRTVVYSILEINVIIALLAAYGFILRNKKIALAYGLTTLYSILIFFLPFFTTASDSVEGITGSDYWHDFTGSFIICLVICLIVLVSLILPLLIRKRGKSALSLLEKGGVITNVKIEILVVIISNIALIVTTYMMVLSEMNRLGSH